MKQPPPNGTANQHVRDIRHKTCKQYLSEEKIRIVISGLRGEHSIAELCRREGIAKRHFYTRPKEFMGRPRSNWRAMPSARRHPARLRI